jgi:hypothetical protein
MITGGYEALAVVGEWRDKTCHSFQMAKLYYGTEASRFFGEETNKADTYDIYYII